MHGNNCRISDRSSGDYHKQDIKYDVENGDSWRVRLKAGKSVHELLAGTNL